jgi:hypothetical protein
VPRALLAHDRQSGLHDPERAEEVRLHLGADLGLGELLDGAEVPEARVVDHHVQPAEPVGGPADRLEHRPPVSDVEAERQQCVAVAGDEVVEGAGIARGGGDQVPAPECRLGPDAPESPGRAGDEPDLLVRCHGSTLRPYELCDKRRSSTIPMSESHTIAPWPR